MNDNIITVHMETECFAGKIQAIALFLEDSNGKSRPSLTGKLVDETGQVIAVGCIHEHIVPAFENTHSFVADFAIAHGCDSNGIDIKGNSEGKAERAMAWERARIAFDEAVINPPNY